MQKPPVPCHASTANPQHRHSKQNGLKKYKELIRDATGERDQPYAMLQENVTNHTQRYRRICVTNHASDRGGVSCSPAEARIQLEVVILGMISRFISYIMAIVSYEIPPLLDCMGFHGPPGSKSRSWRGRGRWGTPDSNGSLYFQDLAGVQTWFTPLRKVTRTSSSLPDTVWHLSMVV